MDFISQQAKYFHLANFLKSRHYLNKCLPLRIKLQRDPHTREYSRPAMGTNSHWMMYFLLLHFSHFSLFFFFFKLEKNQCSFKVVPPILSGIRARFWWGGEVGCWLSNLRLQMMESQKLGIHLGPTTCQQSVWPRAKCLISLCINFLN